MAFAVEKLDPIAAALRGMGFAGVTTEALEANGVPSIRIAGVRAAKPFEYSLAIDGMSDDQVVGAAQSVASGWALRFRTPKAAT